METQTNNRQNLVNQPNTCPNDYMIPFTNQNPAFYASSSSHKTTHLQGLHHLDQFSLNGFTSNPLTYSQTRYLHPLESINSCGSSQSLALNESQLPIDVQVNNIVQSDGLVNHNQSTKKKIDVYDDCFKSNPCFQYINPDDFVVVPHQVPCIKGKNGSSKRARGKKKGIAIPMISSGINKKASGIKAQWTAEEDRHLTLLKHRFGENNWVEIADFFPERTAKQCKERWYNHLKPDIKKDVWSEEEVKILIQSHTEIGNKWTEIAKRLPGRTENTVKNYWNSAKRKQRSKVQYKSCKVSPLLLEYIKNMDSEALKIDYRRKDVRNAVPIPAENTAPAVSAAENLEHQNNDNAVPDFDFGDNPDFCFDEGMFQDIYDLAALLNDTAGDSVVDNSVQNEMPMETAPRMWADENNESWISLR